MNKKQRRQAAQVESVASCQESGVPIAPSAARRAARLLDSLSEVFAHESEGFAPTAFNNCKTPFTDSEKEYFLHHISLGLNRAAALRATHLAAGRLNITLSSDASFRATLGAAEKAREGHCAAVLYASAIDNQDVKAAERYLRTTTWMRDVQANHQIKMKEHKLKARIVEMKLNGPDIHETLDISRDVIPDDEWDEYNNLCDKIENDISMNSHEISRWGLFQYRISVASKQKRLNSNHDELLQYALTSTVDSNQHSPISADSDHAPTPTNGHTNGYHNGNGNGHTNGFKP